MKDKYSELFEKMDKEEIDEAKKGDISKYIKKYTRPLGKALDMILTVKSDLIDDIAQDSDDMDRSGIEETVQDALVKYCRQRL